VLAEIAEGLGVATNNVAEYTAAIRVLLRSDSRLVIEQLAGRWKIKNPTLQQLHRRARSLVGAFERVQFEHVPRERNVEADRLANVGVDAWLAAQGR
jgi:probable phosphoglycerate mutase